MKLFTIVLLTYQQRHRLEQCLKHIFRQDYGDIELIVCDDNSCDFYEDEVEAYISRYKTKQIVSWAVYKQPYYAGEAKNCQTALEMAHGSYITFLRADEEFSDKKSLSIAAECFARSDASVIVSRMQKISEDGKQKHEICPPEDEFRRMETAAPDWLFVEFGTHPSAPSVCEAAVYFRKQYLQTIGFDTDYTSIPFWTLWLKLCEAHVKPVWMDEVTVYKRMYVIEDDMAYMSYGMKDRSYGDCIRLLQNYVYPRLEKYSRSDRMRCRHAVEVIKIVMDDRKWYTWKFRKKLLWKIRKAPTLFLGFLYRVRTGNISISTHNEKRILFIFSLLFYLDISIFSGGTSRVLWAAGAAAAFALFAVKQVMRLCIYTGRSMLNKRMKRKWWD